MKTKPAKIGSHDPRVPPEQGEVCVCEDCGHETWVVFTLRGGAHPHLQCSRCGAVYCQGTGPCSGTGERYMLAQHDPLEDAPDLPEQGEVPT